MTSDLMLRVLAAMVLGIFPDKTNIFAFYDHSETHAKRSLKSSYYWFDELDDEIDTKIYIKEKLKWKRLEKHLQLYFWY